MTGGEVEATAHGQEQEAGGGTEVRVDAEDRPVLGDEKCPVFAIAFSAVNGEEGGLEVGVTLDCVFEFEIGVELESMLDGGFEFDIEAEVDFRPDGGETDAFPETQPGTRSLGEAGSGPSVTATQPGRYFNIAPSPAPASECIGFFAVHDCIIELSSKRPSLLNTGQSSIIPELLVHISTARASTFRSQPFIKSPCNPKPVGSPFARTKRPPSPDEVKLCTMNHTS